MPTNSAPAPYLLFGASAFVAHLYQIAAPAYLAGPNYRMARYAQSELRLSAEDPHVDRPNYVEPGPEDQKVDW